MVGPAAGVVGGHVFRITLNRFAQEPDHYLESGGLKIHENVIEGIASQLYRLLEISDRAVVVVL